MTLAVFKLTSPLRVSVSKTKDFTLNLNLYRNAHYQTLNKAKVEYKNALKKQIMVLPDLASAKIHYTVYPKDKRQFDVSNIVSIHQKFFEDALVELGKLPDDSIRFITESSQSFGEICRDNPRVEITITATLKENDMQITLDSTEIKQAIVGYVKDQGIDLTNTTVEVGMTAGRGPNGPTATVDIIPKSRPKEATGVKETFHSIDNLIPLNTKAEVIPLKSEVPSEDEDNTTTEQLAADSPFATDGPEEVEETQGTNSIFK